MVGPVDEAAGSGTGTSVRFWPDRDIFDAVDLPTAILRERLRVLACLVPGVEVALDDERWRFGNWEVGLEALHDQKVERLVALQHDAQVDDGSVVSISMLLVADDGPEERGSLVFMNFREANDPGPFTQMLQSEISKFERQEGDARANAVMSVRMLGPEFGGPTRARLDDSRAVDALVEMFHEHQPTLRRALQPGT